MTTCTCLVQAGRISAEQRETLQGGLSAFMRSRLGAAAEIGWIEVAPGSGFTAGRPSTSSVVAMTADAPLETTARTAMLHELNDFWTAHAACAPHELMLVIMDPKAG